MHPPNIVDDQFMVLAITGEASGQLRVQISLLRNNGVICETQDGRTHNAKNQTGSRKHNEAMLTASP